jgi:ATP synthase subunit 6
MLYYYQPLEQFEISIFFNFITPFISIILTNYLMYLGLIAFVFIIMFDWILGESLYIILPVESILQTYFRSLYLFIYDLLEQQVKTDFQEFFPLYFYTFNVVLLANLIGLTPFGFTITSHIITTMTLSFMFLVGLTIIGFKINGLGFLNLFVPRDIPKVMVPFLIIFELISYISRVFSLAIRLFANMMSGHALLYILSSFTVNFQFKQTIFSSKIYAFFPILITVLIYGLEIGIAILQAYVFIVLLAIYLGDVLHPVH